METATKHYKFVNSGTGNAIFYYTLSSELPDEKIKQQLETIKAEVAVSNGMFLDTIYWEELYDEEQ